MSIKSEKTFIPYRHGIRKESCCTKEVLIAELNKIKNIRLAFENQEAKQKHTNWRKNIKQESKQSSWKTKARHNFIRTQETEKQKIYLKLSNFSEENKKYKSTKMAFAAARMILKDKRRKSKEDFAPPRQRSKVDWQKNPNHSWDPFFWMRQKTFKFMKF